RRCSSASPRGFRQRRAPARSATASFSSRRWSRWFEFVPERSMKLHFRAVLVAMLLVFIGAPVLASAADGGQIYTWVDKNGVRHYSDHPANPKATAVKELTTHPPGNAATAVSAAPVA